MPLARIITRLPQETAALAEYLRTQGYAVETVSSHDEGGSTLADLEISAEQYSFADAMARAREIAADGWDIMVAPGVIDAAPLIERPAESQIDRHAELEPEPILESQPQPTAEIQMFEAVPDAPIEAAPPEAVPAARLPRKKIEWSRLVQNAFAAVGKFTAAASYVWRASQREAARRVAQWKEFAAAQKAQSGLRAANMAAKMKEMRRLRGEREALETAARLRQMESEREARIRLAHEREERARLLQMEAERESQRRAARVALEQAAAEAARIRELQRQMQIETELNARSESIHRESMPLYLDSLSPSPNVAEQDATASAHGTKSSNLRHRSSRRRDWEMAFAGAAAATIVLVLAFGILGVRRPAEKFAPTRAVEQQLPFGAATIHPTVSTVRPGSATQSVLRAQPVTSPSAPASALTGTKLVATTIPSGRRSPLPNDDSGDDAEVVVRHFAPLRTPARPAAKKSADGVKHYSDIN